MVYNKFCYVIFAVHRKSSLLCILDWPSISASFQVLLDIRKHKKLDIGTPIVSREQTVHGITELAATN